MMITQPPSRIYIFLVTPQPPPWVDNGVRTHTGTLYLLFQTWVVPSLITESKYHIQRYKNNTTTVVVFTVSIHTILSLITYTYTKNVHLHLYNQSAKPTVVVPYKCASPVVCGRSRTSSSVPTRIKTRAKLYA